MCVDICNLAAKRNFIGLKVELDRLGTNKLFNFSANFNELKIKVGDLDVGELNTLSIDLKNEMI